MSLPQLVEGDFGKIEIIPATEAYSIDGSEFNPKNDNFPDHVQIVQEKILASKAFSDARMQQGLSEVVDEAIEGSGMESVFYDTNNNGYSVNRTIVGNYFQKKGIRPRTVKMRDHRKFKELTRISERIWEQTEDTIIRLINIDLKAQAESVKSSYDEQVARSLELHNFGYFGIDLVNRIDATPEAITGVQSNKSIYDVKCEETGLKFANPQLFYFRLRKVGKGSLTNIVSSGDEDTYFWTSAKIISQGDTFKSENGVAVPIILRQNGTEVHGHYNAPERPRYSGSTLKFPLTSTQDGRDEIQIDLNDARALVDAHLGQEAILSGRLRNDIFHADQIHTPGMSLIYRVSTERSNLQVTQPYEKSLAPALPGK